MRRALDLSAYLVLDDALCGQRGVPDTARRAVQGGVRTVQLRLKHASTADRIDVGRAIRDALRGTGAALVINDDADAAKALGSDALHIGQTDMAPAAARSLIGPEMALGLSVETVAQAKQLDPAIVDHAGAGPVFATDTKPDAAAPLGWKGLSDVIAACPVPCVAIGGIKPAHAAAALAAGADGLAVVSAICGQPDPEAAARALVSAIATAKAEIRS